jgi:hypothetical protein
VEQVEGLFVAGDGLGVLAQVMVGVAEAVGGGGLPGAAAERRCRLKVLVAMRKRLPMATEMGVIPADGVEGGCVVS